MFGMEKNPQGRFQFDLEKEIKGDHTRAKAILEKIDSRIQELKKLLREGQKEKEYAEYGDLLLGYTACKKVLQKVAK